MQTIRFTNFGVDSNVDQTVESFFQMIPQFDRMIIDPDRIDENNMDVINLKKILKDYPKMPKVFFGMNSDPQVWQLAADHGIRMVSPLDNHYDIELEDALQPWERLQCATSGKIIGISDDERLKTNLTGICDELYSVDEIDSISTEGVRAIIWLEERFSTRQRIRDKIANVIGKGVPVVFGFEMTLETDASSKIIINQRPWKVVNIAKYGWVERVKALFEPCPICEQIGGYCGGSGHHNCG
jgi:hypothetical protein